jgi:hypothetical protein
LLIEAHAKNIEAHAKANNGEIDPNIGLEQSGIAVEETEVYFYNALFKQMSYRAKEQKRKTTAKRWKFRKQYKLQRRVR